MVINVISSLEGIHKFYRSLDVSENKYIWLRNLLATIVKSSCIVYKISKLSNFLKVLNALEYCSTFFKVYGKV